MLDGPAPVLEVSGLRTVFATRDGAGYLYVQHDAEAGEGGNSTAVARGKLQGTRMVEVQKIFARIFNLRGEFIPDGRQFDVLFADGDSFVVGSLIGRILHTPGHTPACVTFVVGDAAFVGDTLFMPDYGTARADFPGGDAHVLFRSIRKVLSLAPETRLFLCHDYKAPGREAFLWETTVAAERAGNVHVHDGVTEDAFVAMRRARDAQLGMPRLILPSIQVNMRAGELPPPEENGQRYLKIPLNML